MGKRHEARRASTRQPRHAPHQQSTELRMLSIESLESEGRGVARHEGKVVFVEGALPGELVEARTTRTGSSYDQARTVRVLRESASRREPRCPHFGICGGCATQHTDLRTQMAAKQRWLEDSLARIGKAGKSERGKVRVLAHAPVAAAVEQAANAPERQSHHEI